MEQTAFREARHDNITQDDADNMTVEQQRILKLERRLETAESQLLVCLKYIRKVAEERNEALEDELLRRCTAEA